LKVASCNENKPTQEERNYTKLKYKYWNTKLIGTLKPDGVKKVETTNEEKQEEETTNKDKRVVAMSRDTEIESVRAYSVVSVPAPSASFPSFVTALQ